MVKQWVFLLGGGVAILFLFPAVALAQAEPTKASDLLNVLGGYVPAVTAIVTGWLCSRLTEYLKQVSWLSAERQSHVRDALVDVVAVVVPAVLTGLVVLLAPFAADLDQTSLWGLIALGIGASRAGWTIESFRKTAKEKGV